MSATSAYSRRRFATLNALALGLILGSVAFMAEAGEGRLPVPVARALKAAAIPTTAVAVQVREVGAASAHISVNASQSMNPASVMKLVTTYAALELLGPAYTWKTEAWMLGTLADGELKGDLYLKGSGDPKLTFEQFWLLLRQLRARGLKTIHGSLVLDRSLFETVQVAAGDTPPFDDQPLRAYNVEPDALLLNFKALRLQFVPNIEKKSLSVLAEPQPANLDIVNQVVPANGNNGCNGWKTGLRADISQINGRSRLILGGKYPLACGEKTWNLGVQSHPQYVFGVFNQLWRELGGSIDGTLREARIPATASFLTSIESPPLVEIVRDINKFSNNVMARQLFLTLGAESGTETEPTAPGIEKKPARIEQGDAAIRAWLARKELRFPELVMENGSGLSRRERISADSLARLLVSAWKSSLMPEFISSLPISAMDGTMRKRLKQNGAAGQAHIKTGTLDGVKTIAGYILDRAGKWQIVVFLANHANAGEAQAAQDALMQCVYERNC